MRFPSSQIAGMLARFAFPEEARASLANSWLARQGARQSAAQARERLQRKAERIRTVYLEGDIDDREYCRQRAEVAAALAPSPPVTCPRLKRSGAGWRRSWPI